MPNNNGGGNNNNNGGGNNKKQKQDLSNYIRQELGGKLNGEIHDLIDLAVRQQFGLQQFVNRLVNTHYFRHQFPGLIAKGGNIAAGLSGQVGEGVSPTSLTSAITHYNTGLDQTEQLAQQYGFHNFGKDQYAKLIHDQTSPDEFKARLAAVEMVDSNPELKAAYEAQQRAAGNKVKGDTAYKAALSSGDAGFTSLFEGALFQQQLGLGKNDARTLAKGGPLPVGTNFNDIGTLVSEVRNNLQAYAPELANQGINTARLVKVLGNPTAYAPEVDKIKQIAQQRQQQYGQPVAGTYAQQGQSGGFSQYPTQGEAGYG